MARASKAPEQPVAACDACRTVQPLEELEHWVSQSVNLTICRDMIACRRRAERSGIYMMA